MAVSKKARNVPKQFLGAFKKGHRAGTREFIDEELSWQLLDRIEKSNWKDTEAIEALEYITRFNNEYHKNVVKKDDPKALHNEELSNECNEQGKQLTYRQACYARENAKNRDLMSVGNRDEVKNTANPSPIHDEALNEEVVYVYNGASSHAPSENRFEDAIVDFLDAKALLKSSEGSEQ